MRAARIAALAGLVLAAAALAGIGRPEPAQSAAEEPGAGGITVTGTGTVRAVPDRASFWFGVETQAATARAALTANATAAKRLVDALKAAGVAAADLQTQQVSLMPRTSPDGRQVTGYTAANSVTATVRDIGRAGALVDAAVAAGATNVSGPNLTRSNQAGLYKQALQAAVADARDKAETLAATVGRSLGPVTAVVESGGGMPIPFAAADAARESRQSIEPGTQDVGASVTVTFALR